MNSLKEKKFQNIQIEEILFNEEIELEFRDCENNETNKNIANLKIIQYGEFPKPQYNEKSPMETKPKVLSPKKNLNDLNNSQQLKGFKVNLIHLILTIDTNLFQGFECLINLEIFENLRNDTGLNIDFNDFGKELVNTINLINPSNEKKNDILFITNENGGKLTFYDDISYKKVEIFTLNFQLINDEDLKNLAQIRFNDLKLQLKYQVKLLDELNHQIKQKNPIFLEKKK